MSSIADGLLDEQIQSMPVLQDPNEAGSREPSFAQVYAARFAQGLRTDITKYTEAKGEYTYLSWAHALRLMREIWPESTYGPIPWIDASGEKWALHPIQPGGEGGYQVMVWVQLDPTRPHTRFVHEHFVAEQAKGKGFVPILKPNAMDVNYAIMRAYSKCVSMATGIGLHLYDKGKTASQFLSEVIEVEPEIKAHALDLLEHDALQATMRDGKTVLKDFFLKKLNDAKWSRDEVPDIIDTMTAQIAKASK